MEGEKRTATADELLAHLAPQNPGKKLAKSKTEDVIGVWSDEAGRYVSVVCKTILPRQPWVMMDHELKIDGELPKIDWIPYEPTAATVAPEAAVTCAA